MLSAMDTRLTAIERAFELAKAGTMLNLTDLRARLNREGFAASQVAGSLLTRQLRDLILKSREADDANRT